MQQGSGVQTEPTKQPVKHPAFHGPTYQAVEAMPNDSDTATALTIARMQHLALADSTTSPVQSALTQAVRNGAPTDADTCRLIFQYIQNTVRFQTDARTAAAIQPTPAEPHTTEVLIRPADLLLMQEPAGDCDDFSMLTAAMLTAASIPWEFVTIAADPEQPDTWTHVYVHALIDDGQSVAMDTSHGPEIGWSYPQPSRKATWPLHRPQQGTLNGIGFMDDTQPQINWWQNLLQTGANIAQQRYGNAPQVVYQSSPQGTTYTQYQPQPTNNGPSLAMPGMSLNSGSSSNATGWLLIAAAAVILILLMQGGKK